jgi:CubicO group peptidase (beta-lactamase class C family)
VDSDGISHGFADLKLQPRDMAKLGYLWLHHGVWEDKQLVPASYVDAALSPQANVSTNVKYGYGMWLYPNGRAGCPADFEANGNGGQRIAVMPSKDMVVVITGAGLNADDVASLIAPAWRWDRPLTPNPQGDAKLAALVAQAAAPADAQWAATAAQPAAPQATQTPTPQLSQTHS